MYFFNSYRSTPAELVWTKRIAWLLSLGIWSYILYRAIFLEITVDESYSYYLVKMNDWVNLPKTANTHWLNSFFIKIGIWLPGDVDAEWKIRLMTTLCFLPYAFVSFELGQFFRNKWLGYLFFLLAISNPYVITFFSIARGYAPGCLFVLLSLWQAGKLLGQQAYQARRWLWCFVFAGLAVSANFSFFYFFASLSAIYVFSLLRKGQLSLLFREGGWIVTLVMVVVSTLAAGSLWYVRQSGDLYYGGGSGLIDSLIRSQFIGMEYYNIPIYFEVAVVVVFVLGILCFVATWFVFVRSGKLTLSALCTGSFMGIVLLNVLLHAFMHTPYLLARTALPLFFPLVLGILGTVDRGLAIELFNRPVWKVVVPIVAAAGCALFCINFIKSIDLEYIREWRTDIRNSLDYLQEAQAKRAAIDQPIYNIFKNYYQQACPNKYTFGKYVLSTEEMKKPVDSILVTSPDYILLETVTVDEQRLMDSLPIVYDFEGSHSALLKNQ